MCEDSPPTSSPTLQAHPCDCTFWSPHVIDLHDCPSPSHLMAHGAPLQLLPCDHPLWSPLHDCSPWHTLPLCGAHSPFMHTLHFMHALPLLCVCTLRAYTPTFMCMHSPFRMCAPTSCVPPLHTHMHLHFIHAHSPLCVHALPLCTHSPLACAPQMNWMAPP
jgi:hypothetical protein